jgi:hypothetical protein
VSEAAPTGTNKSKGDERAARKAEKKKRGDAKTPAVDIPALEERVRLAELRAREMEAEVRYFEASAKHRDMKSEKRGKKRRDKSGKPGSESN